MKWIKASERLPETTEDVFGKDDKGGKWRVFYTRKRQFEVDAPDEPEEMDLDSDEITGKYWLHEGWYELCEQQGGDYDEMYFKREIVEWLEESPVSSPATPSKKTKEEILDKYYQPKMHWNYVNRNNALLAMEEYASQFVSSPSPSMSDDVREALLKYVNAIDKLYNHNDETREAVIEYFGIHHPSVVMNLLSSRSIKEDEKDLVTSVPSPDLNSVATLGSSFSNSNPQKFHAVEYAGYWNIQTTEFYDTGENILNAEEVGQERASGFANLIANLLNEHYAKRN